MTAIEEEMLERLSDAWHIDHATAADVGDILLDTFDVVRKRHKIGQVTELVIPARGKDFEPMPQSA